MDELDDTMALWEILASLKTEEAKEIERGCGSIKILILKRVLGIDSSWGCPMCDLYINNEGCCKGCPIAENESKSGRACLQYTPYGKWADSKSQADAYDFLDYLVNLKKKISG